MYWRNYRLVSAHTDYAIMHYYSTDVLLSKYNTPQRAATGLQSEKRLVQISWHHDKRTSISQEKEFMQNKRIFRKGHGGRVTAFASNCVGNCIKKTTETIRFSLLTSASVWFIIRKHSARTSATRSLTNEQRKEEITKARSTTV